MSETAQKPTFQFNLTKPAVLDFANLFEPRGFGKKGKETGDPKYSANFIFDKDHPDLDGLKAIAVKAARSRWPERDLKTLKFPFNNGDKAADKRKERTGKDDGAYQRGKVIIPGRSKFEPRLAGIENGKMTDYDGAARVAAKSKFYRGVLCLAQFNFVPYDGVGENPDGVTAYLNLVFTTNKGEKLAGGGGPSAAEVFKGYTGSATEEDPVGKGELSDEISF